MFEIDSDKTIHITRGDIAFFTVSAYTGDNRHKFQPGDVLRMKVMQRKNAENVAFHKDFLIHEEVEMVNILLTEAETKIGDVISKPTDYWYEIELNPYTNPQTIVGYDADGPKIFKLYPEGRDLGANLEKEEIPPVDQELSLTSERPIANQAVARALVGYDERVAEAEQRIKGTAEETESAFKDATDAIAEETKANINEEAESAIGRVHDSSSEADASATRAESAAERAEASASRAEAVVGIEIDTDLSTESYNPIANKAVAEAFENVDAKTLDGHEAEYFAKDADLANYFPKSGGTVNGDVEVKKTESVLTMLTIANALRRLGFRVGADGGASFYDYTNEKAVFTMLNDATNTFNGTASGNLPLTGGQINGAAYEPLKLNSTIEAAGAVYIAFKINGVNMGQLGVTNHGEPIFYATDGSGGKKLLHDGNSAKVHIGATAPNDTTGNVLFINTSA